MGIRDRSTKYVSRIGTGLLLAALVHPCYGFDRKQMQPAQDAQLDFTQPLTLDRAITIGLRNQPQVAIASAGLDSARARLAIARSSYYPQVTPSVQWSNTVTTFRTGGGLVSPSSDSTVSQVALKQLIFDTGKREENVRASVYSAKASGFNLLDVRQAIILNITTDYYDLLRKKELVKVADSSVKRAETTLASTKAFVEAKTSPAKDILQAQADYDNARVGLIQAQNDVKVAQATLKTAMGILTPLAIVTPDVKLALPSATADAKAAQDYVKQAFEARPDLRRDDAAVGASRHAAKVADINAGVQVEANLSEGYRADPDPGENRLLQATVSYPLFDGGLSRATVREAKATLEQSRQQAELTRQSIQFGVEESYLTREDARVRIGATESAVKAAQENFDAAVAAQKEGAGTIIDIITAQNQLVIAQTNAVQALYDFYTADAHLLRAIGGNDKQLAGGKIP